ncbi:hypothetical protein L1887_14083 [Cichorium endivia]|nr:hypothetical protein L1887_14083 [Cichorium endivia]
MRPFLCKRHGIPSKIAPQSLFSIVQFFEEHFLATDSLLPTLAIYSLLRFLVIASFCPLPVCHVVALPSATSLRPLYHSIFAFKAIANTTFLSYATVAGPRTQDRIGDTNKALAEACRFSYNDARYINERAQNDIFLLSRAIMSLDARARQDVGVEADLMCNREGCRIPIRTGIGIGNQNFPCCILDALLMLVSAYSKGIPTISNSMIEFAIPWRLRGIIGADYGRSRPLTKKVSEITRPFNLMSTEIPASQIWIEKSKPDNVKTETMNKDIDLFLPKMLGDGFQLDMDVIKEAVGSCGYDIQESMEKLMNMSSTTLDLGNATSSMVVEIKSEGKLQLIGGFKGGAFF